MQPGETITPGSQPSDTPREPEPTVQQPAAIQPVAPQGNPKAAPNQAVSQATAEPTAQPNESSSNWQFTNDASANTLPASNQVAIQWTASEYVSHDKTVSWFLAAGLAVVAVAAAVYAITRDVVSSGVILVLGLAFAVFAARPPAVLDYSLDSNGVHIGDRVYPFAMFRSFTVQVEGALRMIVLMPLQRFGLPITVHYDPADEQAIFDAIGAHLPYEERKPSPIDGLMRKIRF